MICKTTRALAEDGGVEDAGGEVGAGLSRVAAVLLPENGSRRLVDHPRPGNAHRCNRRLLLGRDGEVSLVDRSLHARVVWHSVLGPAGASSPGQVEDRTGTMIPNHADEAAGRRIHLGFTELRYRWNLALLLEDDDVPIGRGKLGGRGRCAGMVLEGRAVHRRRTSLHAMSP